MPAAEIYLCCTKTTQQEGMGQYRMDYSFCPMRVNPASKAQLDLLRRDGSKGGYEAGHERIGFERTQHTS